MTNAANVIDWLRAALSPFARAADSFRGDDPEGIFKISTLKVRHLRAAADAIALGRK